MQKPKPNNVQSLERRQIFSLRVRVRREFDGVQKSYSTETAATRNNFLQYEAGR